MQFTQSMAKFLQAHAGNLLNTHPLEALARHFGKAAAPNSSGFHGTW